MPLGPRLRIARKRVLLAAVLLLGLLLAGWFPLRYVVAPWAVRRALGAAGLQPATFEIESVGLTGLHVAHLSVGAAPWLTAGTIDVTYSPARLASARAATITVSDATWTIHVRKGSVDWGPARAGAAGPPTLNLPLDRLDVRGSVIRVAVDARSYDLPMDLTLTSSALEGVRGRVRVVALGGTIEVDASASAAAGVMTVELGLSGPIALNPESGGVSGALDSASGRLNIRADDALEGNIALRGGSLRAGDAVLSDLRADVGIRSRHEFEVTGLTATVGDGGTLSAAPFLFDAAAPSIQTRLSVANLSLAEWLPILSDHHATGEGRVSGSVDLSIDPTSAQLAHLTGNLVADPAHGFIQVTDADSLGALLDAQDPRFTTDEVMRPVRDKIVAAFRDFAFNGLTVELSRQQDHTVARAQVSGFGRHGEDPQGLNLTLDLHVQDALLDLASRMSSLAKLKSAAGSALDRFYETNSPEDGHR